MESLAIVSFAVTGGHRGDAPVLKKLLRGIPKEAGDFCADSGYLSREICNMAAKLKRRPYIKPKSNTVRNTRGSQAWREMVTMFEDDRDEFDGHYHQRSRVESVFAALKASFGNSLASKKRHSQRRELALRVICYNVGVLNKMEVRMNTRGY